MNNKPPIDIYDPITNNFKLFLEDPENSKILFSSKFGFGKTTFLRFFFESFSSDYNTIHLFPVNYSISNNKDILSLIKYDIIFQLIEKERFNEDIDYNSLLEIFPNIVKNNWELLLLPLLLYYDPTVALPIYDKVAKVVDQIRTSISKSANDIKDATKPTDKFLTSFLEEEGNPYEQNFITELIRQSIEEEKKQSVLIIDDLDRLDPAHLFRILNIFSAHSDLPLHHQKYFGQNKFNFDKIIFVLDIDNLKHIFHHFYGAETDFHGYINKFYSREIFKFDTQRNISEIVENILKSSDYYYRGYSGQKVPIDISLIVSNLIYVLKRLILNKNLSIREIIKFRETDISFVLKSFQSPKLKTIWNNEDIGFSFLLILCRLFGNSEKLLNALRAFQDEMIESTDYIEDQIELLGPLCTYKQHFFQKSQIKFSLPFSEKPEVNIKKSQVGLNTRSINRIINIETFPNEHYSFRTLIIGSLENLIIMGFV